MITFIILGVMFSITLYLAVRVITLENKVFRMETHLLNGSNTERVSDW